ncbi:hypothetical protein RAS1_31170 [Phycisphaerae bacterium RAS1]|nr:hypothetical protein RAS1_31170 [Phycisphaerae bacterium RAS1]
MSGVPMRLCHRCKSARLAIGVIVGSLSLSAVAPARGDFVPGRLYLGGQYIFDTGAINYDMVWEFDPLTGTSRRFWEATGIRGQLGAVEFTPDGSRLRVAMFGSSRIYEVDGDGNGAQVMSSADGLNGPHGMTYGPNGDFYVVNTNAFQILRYPAAGGPPTVFADAADGVNGGGTIQFAPSGDLYYAQYGLGNREVHRITQAGVGSLFAMMPSSLGSLTIDTLGNVFVFGSFGVWRFDYENAVTGRQIVPGQPSGWGGRIHLSIDENYIYQGGNRVLRVPVEGGQWSDLGLIEMPPGYTLSFDTFDIYVPEPGAGLLFCVGLLTCAGIARRSG